MKIILLNGCGSSGKTSIAKAIQHLSHEPWLKFEMDSLINMMPDRYMAFGEKAKDGYFFLIPGDNDHGPTLSVELGPLGRQVFGALPNLVETLADCGNNLIVDEVLLRDEEIRSYIEALKLHTIYFIGVFCDLKEMQEREFLRGDRAIGLSNDQVDKVHKGLRNYDFQVDTTKLSPFEAAKQILNFVEHNKEPQGLKNNNSF